jgi:hypothetical protein
MPFLVEAPRNVQTSRSGPRSLARRVRVGARAGRGWYTPHAARPSRRQVCTHVATPEARSDQGGPAPPGAPRVAGAARPLRSPRAAVGTDIADANRPDARTVRASAQPGGSRYRPRVPAGCRAAKCVHFQTAARSVLAAGAAGAARPAALPPATPVAPGRGAGQRSPTPTGRPRGLHVPAPSGAAPGTDLVARGRSCHQVCTSGTSETSEVRGPSGRDPTLRPSKLPEWRPPRPRAWRSTDAPPARTTSPPPAPGPPVAPPPQSPGPPGPRVASAVRNCQ